jgi:hypothetical protein
MSSIEAILVLAIIYAIGDYVSNKTKALMPMMFVSGLVFLIGFWTFLPKTIFQDAKIFDFAMIMAPVFVVYLGTMLNLQELRQEYKSVLISLSSITAIAILFYFIATPIVGKEYAVSAAGPVTGGLVATLIVQQAAGGMGLEHIVIFATLLLVLQSFIGMPVAAWCLSREAKTIINKLRGGEISDQQQAAAKDEKSKPWWKFIPATPASLQTPFVLLAKIFFVTWLALFCAEITGGTINKFVMAILFGILFKELGFLEEKVLDKASSTGLALFALFALVYFSIPKATPDILMNMLFPVVVVFAIAVTAVVLVAFPLSKLFGYSWCLCIAIGISCMFGFPGTYMIPAEVSTSYGETEEEKKYILDSLLPKMLVAGFTSVTIASVFVSGIMVKLL